MSHWVSECDLRVLDDAGARPFFYLLDPLIFESKRYGSTIVVPAGFGSDGASIPKGLMSFTGWPGLRAAIVHDWLLKTNMPRETADAIYLEALECCKVDDDTRDKLFAAVSIYTRATAA